MAARATSTLGRMRRLRVVSRPAIALVVLSGLLLGACAKAASEDPLAGETTTSTTERDESPSTTRDVSGLDPAEAFDPEPLDWAPCTYGECAFLEVPLDYEDRRAGTTEIHVARAPAKGDRVGALFVNPGGPGAGGADFAAILSMILPSEITDRFDIVGVDPRGTGESSPIDCGVDATELYGTDHTLEDEEDERALLEISKAYVDDCTLRYGDVLQHVGTRDVARDMNTVLRAMGDEEMNYLGFSYGTAIGQVYADLFPDRVRTMVLDGVLELGPSGLELAATQALGFETALERFVQYCRAAEGCQTADDPLGAVQRVLELSEQPGGIPAPDADRPAGAGEAQMGIAMALYSQSLWNVLDRALANALAGDGSRIVDLADQYVGIGDFEVYFAVNCLDFEWPSDPQEFFAAAKAAAEQAPHFGEAIVNDYVRCAGWPVEQEPLEPVTAPGTPPILVISTTGDPATPFEAGVAVAERLEQGVLVVNDGDGHTVVADGKPCIDDIVVRYLVDLEVPEDGTTC